MQEWNPPVEMTTTMPQPERRGAVRSGDLVRLRQLREEMETEDLKAQGKCLPCRGTGRRHHHSPGGTGINWQCGDCHGTGKQPHQAEL